MFKALDWIPNTVKESTEMCPDGGDMLMCESM